MTAAPPFDVRLSCAYGFAPGNGGVAHVAAKCSGDRTRVTFWADQAWE
jgi:hypothetical protein